MAEAQWREAFNKFDCDGSGVICARELVGLLENLLGDHGKAISVAAVSTPQTLPYQTAIYI